MVVAGISSAVVAGFLLLATGVLYFGFYQKKKLKWAMFPSTSPKILPAQAGDGTFSLSPSPSFLCPLSPYVCLMS